MVQLKDVAQLAGVSTGSVSKVLNNNHGVSERMKKRVEKAVQDLNYKPNMVARSLRTKTTNLIAVMVPYINDPYFSEFFRGTSLALHDAGSVPVLFSSESHRQFTAQEIHEILMRGVDGLFVSTFGWDESVIEELAKIALKIPVVSLKRAFPGTAIHSVNVDDYDLMFKAVQHITDIGHKRIGYIAAGLNLETGQKRFEGYRDALKQAGIEYDETLVARCETFQIEDGYHTVQKILKRFPLPTAIVGANDSLAIGAMKYLESRNVKIPEEIAVMGCDDVPLSTLVSPKLSSVSIPIYEITAKAVNIIIDANKGKLKEAVNIIFSSKLIVRNSTDFSAATEFEFGRFSK